jgi:hypothetical protein
VVLLQPFFSVGVAIFMDLQRKVTANSILCFVHELYDHLLISACQHALNMQPLSILPSDVARHQPCNPTAGLHEEQYKFKIMTHYRVSLWIVLLPPSTTFVQT